LVINAIFNIYSYMVLHLFCDSRAIRLLPNGITGADVLCRAESRASGNYGSRSCQRRLTRQKNSCLPNKILTLL